MPLKAEVNLQRLLVRCEKMAATGVTDENELQRLETVCSAMRMLLMSPVGLILVLIHVPPLCCSTFIICRSYGLISCSNQQSMHPMEEIVTIKFELRCMILISTSSLLLLVSPPHWFIPLPPLLSFINPTTPLPSRSLRPTINILAYTMLNAPAGPTRQCFRITDGRYSIW